MVTGKSFGQSERGEVMLRWSFVALAGIGVALASILLWLQMVVDTRDPIRGPLLTEALNSPVRAGDFLDVEITREKVRDDCPVISIRKFVDEGGRIYDAPPGVSAGGSDDESSIVFRYPVPANLPPGAYDLRVTLTYVCPNGGSFTHIQEPVRFRVSG